MLIPSSAARRLIRAARRDQYISPPPPSRRHPSVVYCTVRESAERVTALQAFDASDAIARAALSRWLLSARSEAKSSSDYVSAAVAAELFTLRWLLEACSTLCWTGMAYALWLWQWQWDEVNANEIRSCEARPLAFSWCRAHAASDSSALLSKRTAFENARRQSEAGVGAGGPVRGISTLRRASVGRDLFCVLPASNLGEHVSWVRSHSHSHSHSQCQCCCAHVQCRAFLSFGSLGRFCVQVVRQHQQLAAQHRGGARALASSFCLLVGSAAWQRWAECPTLCSTRTPTWRCCSWATRRTWLTSARCPTRSHNRYASPPPPHPSSPLPSRPRPGRPGPPSGSLRATVLSYLWVRSNARLVARWPRQVDNLCFLHNRHTLYVTVGGVGRSPHMHSPRSKH